MPPANARHVRRALRSAGVVEGQLVEIKFHGFVRWTGRVVGPPEPSRGYMERSRGYAIRVSWGEAGGEHERDADRGWILHHDREALLRTLTAECPCDGRRVRSRSTVTLVSGPPPGCRFLAPEIDFGQFNRLSASEIDWERFDGTFSRLGDPLMHDPDDASAPSYPLPLLYLVQLELAVLIPDLSYRPRFVSLGAAKIADQLLRCIRPGMGRLDLLLAVLVDLIAIQHRHLTAALDDGVGWRQVFCVAEALVFLLGSHPAGAAEDWSDLCCSRPTHSRSLFSCMVLAIGALFSVCHSAGEIAALLSGGGPREGRASTAGWDRLEEFMHLLCQDVLCPNGFEDHVWREIDIAGLGRYEEVSLSVDTAWEDLCWLYHVRALPRGLRRARAAEPTAESLRSAMRATPSPRPRQHQSVGVGPSVDGDGFSAFEGDTFEDPACTLRIELSCAALFHAQSHNPLGMDGMRTLGAYYSPRLLDLLSRGDRDPLAFEPVDDGFAMSPSDDESDAESDSYSDQESSPAPKRARQTADAIARREALIDQEVAMRALHTSPRTRNLRNRSVAHRTDD